LRAIGLSASVYNDASISRLPAMPSTISNNSIVANTKSWIEKAVIGLNLCPFAKAVYVKNQIRYVVSEARDTEALLADLAIELRFLHTTDPALIDTTVLIHPHVLNDFLDYNDFLSEADSALDVLDLSGELQIASFHPQYQFADAGPDDIENYTNRSPYPILHLLRENSIDRAVEAFPEANAIFEKNMETLQKLGHQGWERLKITR
jgi:hypothetical protein